ncbi:MAG: tetratricopeptide repeat protein [Acidobacteriota bacterium]
MPFVFLALLAAATLPEMMSEAERHLQAERFPQAQSLLEQILERDAKYVEAHYRLGYVLFRQRKLTSARLHLSATVRLAPPAHHARYFLGRIALLENKPLEAISWFQPIAASGETVFDVHSQLAASHAAAGQPLPAIPLLKRALASAPWDGSLYFRLGQLYQQTRRPELARDAFESSRRLKNADQQDVATLMQTATALTAGNRDQARQLSQKILNRSPIDPNALVALGVLYGEAGIAADALLAFERAAATDPAFFQAQYNHGLALLKSGQTPLAIPPLRRAAELLPQSFDANLGLGLALVIEGNYPAAIAPLEKARQADPAHARASSLLATAYLRSQQASQAVPLLQQAATAAPSDSSTALLLVEALNAAEKQEEALQAALAARGRFPSLPQAHLAAAQQFARLGQYQQARPAFEETLRLAPGLPEASLGLADTLQKNGAHPQALDFYRAALSSPSTSLAARLGLARSLGSLRRFAEARDLLEQGLPTHPNDLTLRLELSRVLLRLGLPELAAEQTRQIEALRSGRPQ